MLGLPKEEAGDGGGIYGEGNGMFGKTHSHKVKQDSSERATKTFKGKSYERLYGEEKATSHEHCILHYFKYILNSYNLFELL